MEIPILIEPVNANGYRARSGEPLVLTAEGATEEEALRNLRDLIDQRLSNGAKLVALSVAPYQHGFARFAGTWSPGDPVIDQWKQAVEEHRRLADAYPDY
jgi:hypothetical protein